MNIIQTEEEIVQLKKDILILEDKLRKIQAEINIKKIKLGRDVELLEIKGIIEFG